MTDQLNLFDASAKLATDAAKEAELPAPQQPGHALESIVAPAIETDSAAPPALPPSARGPADDIPSPADYAARRYLEYAMSVVTGRALPSVADGPGARRHSGG